MTGRIRTIVDTDPGTDDALALLMLLARPGVEVVALTTVGGNARLSHCTRNALRLLEHMGRPDVPVYAGSSRPMTGRGFQYSYDFHGPGGLTARLPRPRARPRDTGGVEYLAEALKRADVSLLALGPLTNLGRALARDPHLLSGLRTVVMGGAVETAGNVTAYAEFNIYNDPRAAQAVMSSGAPVELVGLDVCDPVAVRREELPWPPGQGRAARLARRILEGWFRRHPDRRSYRPCDAVAVAALLWPELFTWRPATVTVEAEGAARGQTRARYDGGPVRVAVGVRAREVKEAIAEALGSSP